MDCAFPRTGPEGQILSCGNCMPCRVNKRRFWTGRILMELRYSKMEAAFVTLTYDDEHLPTGGNLFKYHLKRYIDRVARGPIGRTRFFACGEYGDQTQRPHYHAVIFNTPPLQWEEELVKHWVDEHGKPMGYVKIGDVGPGVANYVAGYTIKKMTKRGDVQLDGRTPEFMSCSKRPPLGAAGFRAMLDMLTTKKGAIFLQQTGDVPGSFRTDGKVYPVGRYWRQWLRDRLDFQPPIELEKTTPFDLEYYTRERKAERKKEIEAEAQKRRRAKTQHNKLWRQKTQRGRTL